MSRGKHTDIQIYMWFTSLKFVSVVIRFSLGEICFYFLFEFLSVKCLMQEGREQKEKFREKPPESKTRKHGGGRSLPTFAPDRL